MPYPSAARDRARGEPVRGGGEMKGRASAPGAGMPGGCRCLPGAIPAQHLPSGDAAMREEKPLSPVPSPAVPAADVYWARPAMVAAMLAVAAELGGGLSRPLDPAPEQVAAPTEVQPDA